MLSTEKLLGGGIGWLFIILPLFYSFQFSNPYEFPKFVLLVGGAQVLLLLLVGFVAMPGKSGKATLFQFDRLALLVMLFGSVTFFSDIWGLEPRISLLGSSYRYQGFVTLFAGMSLFFFIRILPQRMLQKVFQGILIGAILASAVALFQGISAFVFHNPSILLYQGRVVGTFGNPNALGGYVAAVLPLVLLPGVYRANRLVMLRSLWLRVGVLLLFFATIVLTGSRSALLAGVITYFLFLVGECVFLKRGKALRIMTLMLFLALLVLAFLFRPAYFLRSSSTDSRAYIWQSGIMAVTKKPLLGYGQENFELIYPKERQQKVDNAHNIFLETAVASGLLGLGLFLGVLFYAFQQTPLMVKLMLSALLIGACFNPLSLPQIALLWTLAGVRKSAITHA